MFQVERNSAAVYVFPVEERGFTIPRTTEISVIDTPT